MPITAATTSSPGHFAALFDLNALQQQTHVLLQDTSLPRRTEVSELLSRHYADKSLIDTWASWCYELSFWEKTSLSMSVVSIAALSGTVIGFAFPLIAIASSILYAAYTLLYDQEQHRRDRGLRFSTETTALTEKLDHMMTQFRRIAADMSNALDKVKVQAEAMLEQNTLIAEHTSDHHQEQEKLQAIITAVNEQIDHTQTVQREILSVVEGVPAIHANIDKATVAVHDFEQSIGQFAKTSGLMHQTETRLGDITAGLKTCVEQMAAVKPQPSEQLSDDVSNVLRASEQTLERVRALRKSKEDSIDKTCLNLSQ